MKSRVDFDLLFVVLLYAAYAAVIVVLYGPERFTGDTFESLPLVMLGISLACTVLWYVLGQWLLRPNASAGTWYAWWAVLLVVVVAAASYISFHESAIANMAVPAGQTANTDAEAIPLLHFLGGVGCFYLATVLFSPIVTRFRIWPARHVRRW